LKFSQEILTEKIQLEALKADEENLESKYKQSEETDNEVDIQINVKKQTDTISERKNELEREKTNALNKEQSLRRQIEESKNTKEVERKKLIENQQDAIE
jgi:hypothetical protein